MKSDWLDQLIQVFSIYWYWAYDLSHVLSTPANDSDLVGWMVTIRINFNKTKIKVISLNIFHEHFFFTTMKFK